MLKAIFVCILMILVSSILVYAKVKGPCYNCYTMHNSQNGSALYTETPKVGGPGTYLLTIKCIACHSSTDSSPTKTLGGNTVPIVYNTVEPSKITAGGNFWYVQNLGDGYGHNVITVDGTLSYAPGAYETNTTCGFEGCHKSLAQIRLGPGPCAGTNCVIGNGCIGCHVPKHHAPDPDPGPVVKEENGCYRFLGRPSWVWDIPPHSSRPCVEGIEDLDWELTVSPADHNEYRDTDKPAAPYSPGSGNPMGISDFCAGCHRDYHSWDAQSRNRDTSGNWLRHPAGDTELPSTGEYAAYTTYNPQAPVSRPNLTTVSNTVTPGVDRVMCLSCHRAHGSPYPDMLRWNYDDMIAGDNSKSGGCFTCHTQKNQTP
jgi:predicted CXXCH cytochrome family protein